jgi:hypothetical protein
MTARAVALRGPLRGHLRVTAAHVKARGVVVKECGAAPAVGALDPGFPTKVGGRHMSEPTSPVRDSSLKDR